MNTQQAPGAVHVRARLITLALAAAACAPAAPVDPARAQDAGPARADAAGPLPPGAKYVAMGSSYASGPGVGPQDPASGGCARSDSNYAHVLARRRALALVDVSCAGATTRDILTRGQHPGAPPQIHAVDAQTRLVTILIGGNDVNYVGNLGAYACEDMGGNSGGPCPAPDAPGVVDAKFRVLRDSLRRVIAAVRQRAPVATVVLVGYLPVVSERGSAACDALRLSAAHATYMNGFAARLAQLIGGIADSVGTPVVRARVVGAGHDACSSAPYTTGYRPPAAPDSLHAIALHPNAVGMHHLAAALDSVLASTPVRR